MDGRSAAMGSIGRTASERGSRSCGHADPDGVAHGPVPLNLGPECLQGMDVRRNAVVGEVATDDRGEPSALSRNGKMSKFHEAFSDDLQLRAQPLPLRAAEQYKIPVLGFPTDVGEPEEVERRRLTETSLAHLRPRESSKANQTGLGPV